jgi:hypothetical protein
MKEEDLHTDRYAAARDKSYKTKPGMLFLSIVGDF